MCPWPIWLAARWPALCSCCCSYSVCGCIVGLFPTPCSHNLRDRTPFVIPTERRTVMTSACERKDTQLLASPLCSSVATRSKPKQDGCWQAVCSQVADPVKQNASGPRERATGLPPAGPLQLYTHTYWVVITPALYSGGHRFKSLFRDPLTWGFPCFFSSPQRKFLNNDLNDATTEYFSIHYSVIILPFDAKWTECEPRTLPLSKR
jgi:hypothetical protein